MKTFIVDADKSAQDALQQFLEARGHACRRFGSGVEAIQALSADRPQLVLCDLDVSGMDGLIMVRLIKQANTDVQVVAMTANVTSDSVLQAFRAGAVDYLRKPIDVLELKAVVDKVARVSAVAGVSSNI